MPRPRRTTVDYARLGASVRVAQLRAELARIYAAFPGLRFQRLDAAAPHAARASTRRRFTAEQRHAISERMTKLWAHRRKAK